MEKNSFAERLWFKDNNYIFTLTRDETFGGKNTVTIEEFEYMDEATYRLGKIIMEDRIKMGAEIQENINTFLWCDFHTVFDIVGPEEFETEAGIITEDGKHIFKVRYNKDSYCTYIIETKKL